MSHPTDSASGGTGAGPFAGPSRMHALVSALDWNETPVGPVAGWPQSLKATVKTLLSSRYPMILTWGPQFTQFYNDAYSQLIGERHPAALGNDIRLTLAESWETLGPMIAQVMETGAANWTPALPLEMRRSGYREETYFSVSHAPAEDDAGRIHGMLAVCSEVTQQVLAERRTRLLRDLTLKAGAITDSVTEACREVAAAIAGHPLDVPFALLYLLDDAGTLTRHAAVGIDEAAAADWTQFHLHHPDQGRPLERALAGETLEVGDIHHQLALRGGFFDDPVQAALFMPLPGAQPRQPSGVLVVGISPNRELDESYRSFCELLASQVSVALRNARAYEEARNRAEALAEVDRAKTAFFSNISHEFRTPLTLILGPVAEALTDEEGLAGERLQLVHRNTLRLHKMVDSLLDFSRVEAGRAQARFTPVDLAAVTASLASNFRAAAEGAGLELIVECPPLPEDIFVDPEMWEKVVLNLISNAIKYTHHGAVSIVLRWCEGYAELQVRDTGIGISKSEQGRVFERFYRASATQGRSFEGTGIGLALVQELVKLHGGEIALASTPGEGSIFTVRVPAGNAHIPPERLQLSPAAMAAGTDTAAFIEEALQWSQSAPPTAAPASTGATESAAPSGDLTTARILLVDDNPDLRAYVAGLLRGQFHNVICRADGIAALAEARETPPDLIVSDVMMPGLDGFGLVRELRADARTRAIPIILLSARAGPDSTIDGLQSGADDYLVKPFAARELVARVRTQLEMARVRREVHRQELTAEHLRATLRERDEFLAVAAHELRTPITALQLQVQSLIHGPLAASLVEPAKARLEGAERSVARLADLVNVMLDTSRLSSGRAELRPERAELSEIIRRVVDDLAADVRASGSVLALDLPAAVDGYWDVGRVQQILSRLLSNALKYGGGGTIAIGLKADTQTARVSIRDQGLGIEPAHQRQIFQRFARLNSSRHYGGLGLGLWTVREITDHMGGHVDVVSEPGQGAIFTVHLPRRATHHHNEITS